MKIIQKAVPAGRQGFVTPLLLAIVAILLIGGGVYVYKQQTKNLFVEGPLWEIYTNSNPAFSFGHPSYPSYLNQPVIRQQSTTVVIDFGNKSGFSVTTGFNYDQLKGRNLTVSEIVNGYKVAGNQNVQIQDIKVDGHLASKITYYGVDTKKNYTDVYIYQDQQIQESYIELSADDSVDATTFNSILSTFKFLP